MRAAWIHDHPFYISKDQKIYSKSGVSYQSLSRYLPYFENLLVTGRRRTIQGMKTRRMTCCNGDHIEFKLINEIRTPLNYFTRRERIAEQLREIIDASDCCIIVLPSLLGMIAMDECERVDKPYLVQIVGCIRDAMWKHGSVLAKLATPVLYHQMRKRVRRAGYVAYITSSFLQKRYPTSGKCAHGIANVDVRDFRPEILEKRLKMIEGRRHHREARIGLIGSLDVGYKGHDVAIRALARVVKEYPKTKLHFLGAGSKTRWEYLASKHGVLENVVFEGTLPSGEPVMRWLDSIDVYIQPSTAEAHGRAIVEAMSRGCPVFASNVGGVADSLLREYLHPPKDSQKLAFLILRALKDLEYAKRCAITNFNMAKKFDNKRIEHKRKEFFEMFIRDNALAR